MRGIREDGFGRHDFVQERSMCRMQSLFHIPVYILFTMPVLCFSSLSLHDVTSLTLKPHSTKHSEQR